MEVKLDISLTDILSQGAEKTTSPNVLPRGACVEIVHVQYTNLVRTMHAMFILQL